MAFFLYQKGYSLLNLSLQELLFVSVFVSRGNEAMIIIISFN